MKMRLALRWLVSLPAAVFYSLAAVGVYQNSGSPNGVPAMVAALCSMVLDGSIALWVIEDAHRKGRRLPYDFGSFVYFAWPFVVPIYLFSTRGWRGVATLGWFVILYALASIVGLLAWLIGSTRYE